WKIQTSPRSSMRIATSSLPSWLKSPLTTGPAWSLMAKPSLVEVVSAAWGFAKPPMPSFARTVRLSAFWLTTTRSFRLLLVKSPKLSATDVSRELSDGAGPDREVRQAGTGPKVNRAGERGTRIVVEDGHGTTRLFGDDDVLAAVAIDVGQRDVGGCQA